MKSTIARRHELDLSTLVINEVSLIGSRCGPFAPAIVALSDERLRVEPLLDEIRPLSDGLAAFERAGRPGALKLLLKPEG
jgi:threonine dehydrogenase-like Zn-dependent dehydrogenase